MPVGPEELLAEAILLGGDGGVAGGANLFPRLYVKLFKVARDSDLLTAHRLHNVVIKLVTTLSASGRHGSSLLGPGTKPNTSVGKNNAPLHLLPSLFTASTTRHYHDPSGVRRS